MADADLWKNRASPDVAIARRSRELADAKIKEAGELNDLIKKFSETEESIKKLEMRLGQDAHVDVNDDLYSVKRKIRQLETEQLFTGRYDKQSATISIFAGAGGQDAEDWTAMLYEMYFRFSENRGWKVKVIDESLGDFQSKTGRHPLKNVIIEIKGDYAYGFLKNESGVHRLVRISPFSPEKKRHTSFALVEVLPDLPEVEEKDIKISDEDLKIEFARSGGPGGQNVNKVETAVRIVHLPTNISASCRAERSQQQNRERAMKLLKSKLFKLMEDKQTKELSQLRTKVKPEWGSQIRSYVLNPYQLVKDHRTNIETTQVEKVLDGDIDIFVENEV